MQPQKHSVYILDDDREDLSLLSEVFREAGCTSELRCFETGAELLKVLASLSDRSLPDIIIIDYLMPQMNGGDVVNLLRDNPRYGGIALGIYSTVVQDHQLQGLLLNGADFYIQKGSRFDDMQEHVKLFCEKIVERKVSQPSPFL